MSGQSTGYKISVLLYTFGIAAETHVQLDAELSIKGFTVVSFELPGFGFSTPPPGFNFTLAANEAVVAELLDELSPRLPRPVTLALSCVAGLAARRLVSRPDAQSRWGIEALVSIQTPSHAAEIAWARREDRQVRPHSPMLGTSGVLHLTELLLHLSQGLLHTPVLGQTAMLALHGAVIDSWYRVALGRGRADPLRAPLEAAAHAARKAGAHNCLASAFQMLTHTHETIPAASLPSSPLPALSVWGAADRSHRGTDRSSSLAGWPGGSESVEFPDAGHFPELEAPQEFAEALSAFVRGAATALPHAGEPRL